MRRLLVMRHGEAEAAAVNDYDRVLTAHGREQVRRVGRHMVANGFVPEHIVVSTAARTRGSCEIVQHCLGATAPNPMWEDAIYLADADALLRLLQEVDEAYSSVLLIGHNPGLSYLVATLAHPVRTAGLPTAGFRVLEFAGSWQNLGPGAAQLVDEFNP